MEITDNTKTLANALAEIEILRKQLEEIPEGCTVADAKKLREANHALAIENFELKKKLEAEPQAVAIPKGYQEEWKRNVMLMWSCVRKHDSSIPSDVLDFMREFLLSAAPKPEGK